MFGKATDEWSTPQALFDALNAEFEFAIDAAASPENYKCWMWWGPKAPMAIHRNALASFSWPPTSIWLNPPYSKVREFITKAALEARGGATVVCLVPSRTDTRWWHSEVWDAQKHTPRPGVEIRFVKGRLKFGNATNSAPFPSVVLIFRPRSGVAAVATDAESDGADRVR